MIAKGTKFIISKRYVSEHLFCYGKFYGHKKNNDKDEQNNVYSLEEVQTCKGKGMVNSQRMVNSCNHLDRIRNASDFCVFNFVSCNFI